MDLGLNNMIRCSFLCIITLFILSLLIAQGVSVQIACYGCMCDDVLEYCEFMDRCCGSCEELCRVDYPDATCSGKCEAYLMQQISTTTTPQQVMTTSMEMRPNATVSLPVHSRDSTIQPSAGALTAIFVSIGLLCLALGIPLVLYFKRPGSNNSKTPDIEPGSVEKLPAPIASDTATSTSDIPLLALATTALTDDERERSYSDTHGSFPSGAQPNTQPNTQLAPVHTPPNNMEGSTIPPTTSMSQLDASDRIGGNQDNEEYSTLPRNPGHTTPSPEDSITSYTTSMSRLDGSGSIRRNQGEQISSSSYDPTKQNYPMNLKEDVYGQEPMPALVHDTKWKQPVSQPSNNFGSTSPPTLSSEISNN